MEIHHAPCELKLSLGIAQVLYQCALRVMLNTIKQRYIRSSDFTVLDE